MRPIQWLGPAVLGTGVVVLALAVGRGEASLYLVVVVPVIAGPGPLAFLRILLVFVGFLLTFLVWATRTEAGATQHVDAGRTGVLPPTRRWGGVAPLGP